MDSLFADEGERRVLAEVNGEIIDEGALQERVKAIHLQKLGSKSEAEAGSISIGEIVESIVDDRLIIQEARLLELDKAPDFVQRLDRFVKTRAVLRLRQEEVLDKIDVSEEQILGYFQEQHRHTGPASEATFEREKKRIERKLRKEQEKGLSDRFVALLREAADIWIDRALMEQVDPEKDYSKQTRSVARVDGKSIPLGEFVGDLKKAVPRQSMQGPGKGRQLGKEELRAIKERVMDRLITYILVENEALRRNYNDAAFAGLVEKRKAALLVDAFKAKLVYPLAIPTEGELRKYYDEHVEDFKKGYEVWIREMRFQEQRKAEEIHKELRQGASFEFLEAEVSGGMTPRKDTVWVPVDRFAPVVRAAVSGLKVGEVSDVIGHGRKFKIIKLKGKRGGNPVAFSKVEERLKGLVGQEKFKRVLAEYLSRLRKASKIKIHEKNLEEIEDDFWRGMPEKQEAHGTQG